MWFFSKPKQPPAASTPPVEQACGWQYNDANSQYKAKNDCVIRAIAIATDQPHQDIKVALEVYQRAFVAQQKQKNQSQYRLSHSVLNGVYEVVFAKYLAELGFIEVKHKFRMVPSEMPKGVFIARSRKHIFTVKDKVVQDTWPSHLSLEYRDNRPTGRKIPRTIYRYWTKR